MSAARRAPAAGFLALPRSPHGSRAVQEESQPDGFEDFFFRAPADLSRAAKDAASLIFKWRFTPSSRTAMLCGLEPVK
jgi:hypothetical protein